MRRAALLLVAACGRIGFGEGVADDGVDAPPGATVALCDAHTLMDVGIMDNPTTLRAIAVDDGYVVALGTASGAIYMIRVNAGLNGAEIHLPFTGGYQLGGLAANGSTVFVSATTGGTGYLKLIDPSFDFYLTIEGGDDIAMDPPLAARANGRAWRVSRFSGFVETAEMDAAGNKTGVVANYAPTGTAATISKNRVVYEIAGRCETFVVDDAGVTSKLHAIESCTEPHVVAPDGGSAVLAIRKSATQVALYSVPDTVSAMGQELSLGDVTKPRLAPDASFAWVAYQKATGVALGRYDAQLVGSLALVPEVKGPFDLTRTALFWFDSPALRVGTPCMR